MPDFATLLHELGETHDTVRRLLHVTSDAALQAAGKRFDAGAYRRLYPDVDQAMHDGVVSSALSHWREWGFAEGRQAPISDLVPKATRAPLPVGNPHDNYAWCLAQQRRMPLVRDATLPHCHTILIYVPRAITPTSGGLLVLGKLCDMLRQRGVDARLWLGEPAPARESDPYAPYANGTVDPRESLVIYPEITCDNPLQGRRVVRWLLNRPGIFGRHVSYSPQDLIVHHSPFCAIDPDPALELCVLTWERASSLPTPARTDKACYVVRKGHQRPRMPLTDGALCLDDASVPAVAQAFNTHARFYSYDLYTFLTVQAAMAGATSVVIPDPELSAQAWRRIYRFGRYGVAYGVEEIDWAARTRHLIPNYLEGLERDAQLQVDAFLARLEALGWWECARSSRTAHAVDSPVYTTSALRA